MTALTRLNDWLACGTNADRLAYTPTPATPASGHSPAPRFYETDTGHDYVWDFSTSAWVHLTGGGGGGGGAVTQVGQVTTTSSAASISFSSIPNTATDLILSISGQVNFSSSGDELIRAQFNGDTGSNYDFVNTFNSASGPSGADGYGVTSAVIGDISTNFLSATEATAMECTIYNYAGTTFYKNARWRSSYRFGTSAGNFRVNDGSTIWQSAAAISSMLIFPAAGTFTDGTVATLWTRT